MVMTTPFHERLAPLNETHLWSHWSGYLSAVKYQMADKFEYFAIRIDFTRIPVICKPEVLKQECDRFRQTEADRHTKYDLSNVARVLGRFERSR